MRRIRLVGQDRNRQPPAGAECLGEQKIQCLVAAVDPWHIEVVRKLRALRKRLKLGFDSLPNSHSQALHRAIQAIEIDAEHVEQLALAGSISIILDVVVDMADRAAVAVDNLRNYLALVGADSDESRCRQLTIILAACFPELAEAEISNLL